MQCTITELDHGVFACVWYSLSRGIITAHSQYAQSRIKPVNLPATRTLFVSGVSESVVQSARPALPELDHLRLYTQTAPKLGHWYLVLPVEFLLDLFDLLLQFFSSLQHLALLTCPRAYSTPSYPCIVVDLTLFALQTLGRPFDSDLSFQLVPPECQAGVWITCDVFSFATRAPVAIDDPSLVVEFFQVNHTSRNAARWQVSCRQSDGLWLVDTFFLRVLEPCIELSKRALVQLILRERAFGVLLGLL